MPDTNADVHTRCGRCQFRERVRAMNTSSVGNCQKPGVCFLLETFHPIVNGAAVQILLIGERLVRFGAKVTVITRKIQPHHRTSEEVKGTRVIRVKPVVGLKRIGKFLMLPTALFTLWKERKGYDVIVVCDFRILGLLGILAARLFGKTCVLRAESCGEMDGSYATRHSHQPSRTKQRLINLALWLRNLVLMRTDLFLSISSIITNEFRRAGVDSAAIVQIPNAIDLTNFAPATPEERQTARQALGIECRQRCFIYTGRLARGKGLEYLLRVWARLKAHHPHVQLFLVGAGQGYTLSCEDELRSFVAANGLESSVTFTGNVSNVNQYLKASDFFVFPSQSEAFGLSLVEAMACGLPCVTTQVGGIVEIIDPGINGILVPYGDEEALLVAMGDLLCDYQKALDLGIQARRKVLDKYDIDRVSAQYLRLLETITKSPAH
jgi:glycosyltransferase involved in cell wall biosynthesis